jgi:hypothetical protein
MKVSKTGVSLPPVYKFPSDLTLIAATGTKYKVYYTDVRGTQHGIDTWFDKSGKLTSDDLPDFDVCAPLTNEGRGECRTKRQVLLDTLGTDFDAVITSEYVRSKDTASELAGLGHKQHEYGSSKISDPSGITHIVLEVSNPVGR